MTTRRHRYLLWLLLAAVLLPAISVADEPTSKDSRRLGRFLKRFPEADANKDGVLTRAEAAAHWRKVRKRSGDKAGPKPTWANVRYGPADRNVLDVWQATSKTPTPVLIYFHGGGFVGGNKSLSSFQRTCLAKGITAVSANYRLTRPRGVTVLDSLHDGARVVQFVRSRARQWNIDPDRIAVSGSSAGGCMSVWLALHDDLAAPNATDPIKRLSSRVTCAVGWGAQTTLDPAVILRRIGGGKHVHPSLGPIFDVDSLEQTLTPRVQELIRKASAIRHADKDDSPLYLIYGDRPPKDPYPADTSHGTVIHSARFGLLLKKTLDPLGVECTVSHKGKQPKETELAFLLRHVGKTAGKQPDD